MTAPRLKDGEVQELAAELLELKLYETDRQERPVAIILAGQSGAGKSTVAHDLRQSLEAKGGYITVDADQLRSYLPYYDELDHTRSDMSEMTQADAGKLADAVRDEAVRNRRHVVIDGTLRDSDRALELAKSLRDNGYRVELHAMAVNEQISFERATMRFEQQRGAGSAARYVPRDWHDRSFSGMADSVRRLEYSAAVDRVAVYDRVGNVVHEQAPLKGKVTSAAYLEAHRGQLTDFERVDLAESWTKVLESMERRGATGRELLESQLAAERAHYTLRKSDIATRNFEHRNPEEIHTSRELASSYGEKLHTAFNRLDLHAAREMPELQSAFAAQAAAAKYIRQHPQVPAERFESSMRERIGEALRDGKEIKRLQVSAKEQVAEVESPELDF